jgi:quaternary ammonium compound-resistance protein SugE
MKLAQGYSKYGPLAVTLVWSVPVSLLMGAALKSLPAGTVYAGVIGLGTIGASLIGMAFFDESTQALRVASLALVIIGLIGLKFFATPPA